MDFISGDSIIEKDAIIEPYKNFNSAYANYLMDWLGKFNFKTENVYFIITSRHSQRNLKYIMSLAEILKSNGYNVFNLADSNKYPELYKQEYSFDRGHLNLIGNQFFNQYLAELYNRSKQEK